MGSARPRPGISAASGEADVEVLIVGAGPCGLCLGNLLGIYGISTTIVEREAEGYAYPRAVGIDDESLRTCQTFGLAEAVLADVLENMPIRYHNSVGDCFAHVQPSAKPFGWARRNLFLQPIFEATLRRGLERFDHVRVEYGVEALRYLEGEGAVELVANGEGGNERTLRAAFLVGADGGRSTIRSLAGIELSGETAPDRWLVVDVENDTLDAPYSAVYCDPSHPVLMVPLPHGHRRFEFKLGPEETDDEATDPARILEQLATRYGETKLPDILRARVYTHHSRVAETFRSGRLFLAGDAAHLQPPFFGQGMNSGIRDATNLAWKLAAVVSGRAPISLLETYDLERRGHAEAMVSFATRMGRLYTPMNRMTERLRDVAFKILKWIPGAKEYILQMKYKPMPRYEAGVVVAASNASQAARARSVGTMFMQPLVERAGGERVRLDEVLGAGFAMIGIGLDPAAAMGEVARAWWKELGGSFVHVAPPKSRPRASDDALTRVVEDVDGAFRDLKLESPREEIIVLRPDRYVAAVCDRRTVDETIDALRRHVSGEPTR